MISPGSCVDMPGCVEPGTFLWYLPLRESSAIFMAMNRNALFTHPLIVILALGVVGCGGTFEDDDDEVGLTLSQTGDSDGFSPYIIDGEMICNPGTTSPDALNVIVKAGDPQGTDTLDRDGTLSAYDGSGDPLFEDFLMPCNTSGDCTAGFTVDEFNGLDCSSAGSFTFYAVVMDEEGNYSEPGQVQYSGR